MRLLRNLITLGLLLVSMPFSASAQSLPSYLLANEKNTISVFQHLSGHVVYVHRLARVYNFDREAFDVPVGSGSGIVWDKQGHIVTNYHVVRGAKNFAITFNKGKTVRAHLVGVEPRKDIAVLQIKDAQTLQALQKLPSLKLGNSNELVVGQKAIAIGNPFGLDRTLTTGIISALGRRVPGVGGVSIRDMIQTDASINPGNSGGPLLNSRGELIGMNTAIYSRSGASAGIGFAVPINDINRIVQQILRFGRVITPGLGITRVPDTVTRQLGVRGVLIAAVVPNTPAASAGLRSTRRNQYGEIVIGDIITAVDGKAVKNYDDLYNVLNEHRVGERVKITLERNGKSMTLELDTIDIGQVDWQ